MTKQAKNAASKYRSQLEKALAKAPRELRAEITRDADEFLLDEVNALDVGRLMSESATYDRFVQQLGTPQQLVESYLSSSLSTPGNQSLLRKKIVSVPLVAPLMAVLICGFYSVMMAQSPTPEKVSPFTKVEFKGDTIIVEFKGESYEWLEIDGLAVTTIVASAKKQFSNKWQKRIAEDLVEVLAGMNHKAGDTVKLKLLDEKSKEEVVVKKAAMTERNRREVWKARADVEGSSGASNIAPELTPELVEKFQTHLQQRWAYYGPVKERIVAKMASLNEAAKKKVGEKDEPATDTLIELQKVIAKGIDGHASVRGWRLPGNCLPFLIESVGDRYVAFTPDRKSFVDPKHPFIDSIDGVSISDWCNDSSVLVAQGSSQLVRARSIRLLRHIDYWRAQRGLPINKDLVLELSSSSGDNSVKKTVTTHERKPTYGDWPRKSSKMMDNKIGYLRIPGMDDSLLNSIHKTMNSFKDARGIVIDVRGNGGGTRSVLRAIGSYLLADEDAPRVVNVGKYRLHPEFGSSHLESRYMYSADSKHWNGKERAAIADFSKAFTPDWNPPSDKFSDWHYMVLSRLDEAKFHYDKPVVVLLDSGCFSATDIFLAGLKGFKNVTLVGTPSSGGSARSTTFKIPGSDVRAKIASMASFQPSGKLYDGHGVDPDLVIEPSPGFFIGKDDPVLERAIRVIAKGE